MKNSAALSVLGAGTLWGLIGLFVHILAGKGFDPLQITTLRVTTAMVLTGLIIGRRDAKLFAIAPKDSWLFFGNGVIGLVFFNWCYFNAIAGGSLAIAALLLYTAPDRLRLHYRGFFRKPGRQQADVFVRVRQRLRICLVQHFRQAGHAKIFSFYRQSLVFYFCCRIHPPLFRPCR